MTCDDCSTFTLTGDSYTVNLKMPIPSGESYKVGKEINRDSFWSGNYEIDDEGISEQPLVLNGIEFAACADDISTVTNNITQISEMRDNNEEIVITGLGTCMNGTYIIKNFSYRTIPRTINAYTWTLVLEKV